MKLVATICIFGSCPSIFKTEDGNFIIVGKKIDPINNKDILHKIGEDEVPILLSKDEFNFLLKALSLKKED